MFDQLLEIGASFDYFSPTAALIGDLAHGGGYTFLIPLDTSPMTGRDIEKLLRRYGCTTWGAMIVSGTIMISVRQSQAHWAQHLLDQAGVPTESGVGGEGLHETDGVDDWVRNLLEG